jgi:hypothetical protein
MAFIQRENAFSHEFLKRLVENTIKNGEEGRFVYDQMHFVNMDFILENKGVFCDLLAKELENCFPDCKADDFAYVNDFVAPVNLDNAQIHTADKKNKYSAHVDAIDRFVGPCYNIWIPLFSSDESYDGMPLLQVLHATSSPNIYDFSLGYSLIEDREDNDDRKMLDFYDRWLRECTGSTHKKGSVATFSHVKGRWFFFDREYVNRFWKSVFLTKMGSAVIFDSSQIHQSGDTSFRRVGISIKFIYKPALTTRAIFPHGHLTSWSNIFLLTWQQTDDLTKFIDFVPDLVQLERNQKEVEENSSKIKCIVEELKKIKDKML